MVNGYSTIKEGFASTPNSDTVVEDKIADITAEIKDLEEELKFKKDELLMQVKKQVATSNKKSTDSNNMAEDIDMNEELDNDDMPYMDDEEDIPEDEMDQDTDIIDDEEQLENAEDDMDQDNDLIEGFKNGLHIEGFRGSIIIMKRYLHDLLKAVLLALLFYLLSSKDMYAMTKQIHIAVKDIVSHNILHTLIFLVIAFLIIGFVM